MKFDEEYSFLLYVGVALTAIAITGILGL